mgnify:CR=1 FL=1|tara:strand:+ start:14362 stop:14481 length:120 start_codon:yes stop_codon:yes gene_type:complete
MKYTVKTGAMPKKKKKMKVKSGKATAAASTKPPRMMGGY